MKPQSMDRKDVYSIEYTENENMFKEKVLDIFENKNNNISPMRIKQKINFDGDDIKLNSLRYYVFFTNDYVCPICGLRVRYFAKEKHFNDKVYHLNLYGVNDKEEEVLFSKYRDNKNSPYNCIICKECRRKLDKEYDIIYSDNYFDKINDSKLDKSKQEVFNHMYEKRIGE